MNSKLFIICFIIFTSLILESVIYSQEKEKKSSLDERVQKFLDNIAMVTEYR